MLLFLDDESAEVSFAVPVSFLLLLHTLSIDLHVSQEGRRYKNTQNRSADLGIPRSTLN